MDTQSSKSHLKVSRFVPSGIAQKTVVRMVHGSTVARISGYKDEGLSKLDFIPSGTALAGHSGPT